MYTITAKLLASILSLTSLCGFGAATPAARVNTTTHRVVYSAPAKPATTAPKTTTAPKAPATTTTTVSTTAGMTAEEAQMLKLVNTERTKAGLPALQADSRLVKTAGAKSQDMITMGYFDHQSPDLGSPFDQMRAAGIQYSTAGENIAGNHSVDAAHQALMNSAGHRANILNPSFKKIGIGIVHGGTYGMMFTQQFIG